MDMTGWEVPRLQVKHAGLAIADPTLSDPYNWNASFMFTFHLVDTLQVRADLQSKYHEQIQK